MHAKINFYFLENLNSESFDELMTKVFSVNCGSEMKKKMVIIAPKNVGKKII